MNIELDEVVVQNASVDALELAACSAQGGWTALHTAYNCPNPWVNPCSSDFITPASKCLSGV